MRAAAGIALLCVGVLPAQVDRSGVDRFFALSQELVADREVGEAQWKALFATPGYALMAQRERSDRLLPRLLPLALRPGQEDARAAETERAAWASFYFDHYRAAWDQRERLLAFVAEVEALREPADRMAREWLPDAVTEGVDAPRISLVVLEPDARGYDHIVADLGLLTFLGREESTLLLAHEMHHVYRNPHRRFAEYGDLPEADLLQALDNLQAEGIADMVNKGDPAAPPERPVEVPMLAQIDQRYLAAYRDYRATVELMDGVLCEYGARPENAPALGRKLRGALLLGGHPVGYAMAQTIAAQLGRERLIEGVTDPVAFLRAYDAACAQAGEPGLSPEALAAAEVLAGRVDSGR